MGKPIIIEHFSGGHIHIETPTEAISFALGRIDRCTDLTSLSALAISEKQPEIASTLELVTAMLYEAMEALK